jgi:hypothetical protein
MYRWSELSGIGGGTSAVTLGEVTEGIYMTPVSGSTAAPPQFAPPTQPGIRIVPCFPSTPFTVGGVNMGPYTKSSRIASASARSSGVKSIRSSVVMPWWSKGRGQVGKGCVSAATSPGTFDGGTGRSSIGHRGSPVSRSNAKTNACLVTWATAFTGRPSIMTSSTLGAAGGS